jgi:hypothetical protein
MLAVALLLIVALTAGPAAAATFKPTIYSDGYSCPSNCDAHVVFHKSANGTRNAYLPSSSPSAPKKCVPGEECRICFSNLPQSCMTVMYRKAGPSPGRFDFTPAFYQENCGKPGIPDELVKVCASFDKTYAAYTKDSVYCPENPAHPGCAETLAKANSLRIADEPFWQECRSLGEKEYNKKYAATPARQRSNACAYEFRGTGGPNTKGETWRRLLPAACWPNTYVGRDGLDCCDARKMSLGGLAKECTPFLVKK